MEDYAQAIEAFEAVVNLEADNVEAYRGLGQAHFEMSNFSAAVDAYTKWADLDPENAAPFNALGWTWFSLGEFEQAIAAFKTALSKNPGYYSGIGAGGKSNGTLTKNKRQSNTLGVYWYHDDTTTGPR